MKKGYKVLIVLLLIVIIGSVGASTGIIYFSKEKPKEIGGDSFNASLAAIYKVTYDLNGAKEIGSDTSECLYKDGNCTITTTTITANDGYKVIGWATSKDATEKTYDVNEEISVNNDMTLYAITKKIEGTTTKIDVGEVCNTTVNTCKIGIELVDVACTQVGYTEKATDASLDSCAGNLGSDNFNKYGNNGNGWDAAFIDWNLKKVKIDLVTKGLKDAISISSYITWARDNNRWFTSKSNVKSGDLVITENNSIGIVFYDGDILKMIIGNSNDKVRIVEIDKTIGYINMNGLAY